jgi:hypothetical protein
VSLADHSSKVNDCYHSGARPLALSLISLIKLSNTVLTGCAEYVDKVKNVPGDTSKIISEVSGLEFSLKRLSKLASPSSPSESDGNHSSNVNGPRVTSLTALHRLSHGGPFKGCEEILVDISRKKKLEVISDTGSMRRRLILWLFESGKLEKLLPSLESTKLPSCLHSLGIFTSGRRAKPRVSDQVRMRSSS